MDSHFSIRLTAECVSARDKLPFDFFVIFKYAVVDKGDRSRTVQMRMCIGVCDAAVCGPPRMSEGKRTFGQSFGCGVADFSCLFLDRNRWACSGNCRNTPAVIPPVFKIFEPGKHDVCRIRFISDVSENSAHMRQ